MTSILMSNQQHPYKHVFHFKKFSLSDANCGMKIGTDGVLLGSLAATYNSHPVLDVGTGCGLIALMIAQKNQADITAIEIDRGALSQASENIKNSPWLDRIKVINTSFQEFASNTDHRFGLVVCNPPFFHNSLKPGCTKRSDARHSSLLSPHELLAGAKDILTHSGSLLIIIPYDQRDLYTGIACELDMYITRTIVIYPNPTKTPVRLILEISLNYRPLSEDTLCIEDNKRHEYSSKYRNLTKDYYLHF